MYLIQCPSTTMIDLDCASEEQLIAEFKDEYGSEIIFLGGGITSCPEWQPIVIDALKDMRCVLINPRRKEWDINDKTLERKQIEWEHYHLENCMSIIFWFPKETLCPITLFELGKSLNKGYKLYIGCHPEYARRNDVKIQVELEDSNQIIHDSLEDLISEIRLDLIEKI